MASLQFKDLVRFSIWTVLQLWHSFCQVYFSSVPTSLFPFHNNAFTFLQISFYVLLEMCMSLSGLVSIRRDLVSILRLLFMISDHKLKLLNVFQIKMGFGCCFPQFLIEFLHGFLGFSFNFLFYILYFSLFHPILLFCLFTCTF